MTNKHTITLQIIETDGWSTTELAENIRERLKNQYSGVALPVDMSKIKVLSASVVEIE